MRLRGTLRVAALCCAAALIVLWGASLVVTADPLVKHLESVRVGQKLADVMEMLGKPQVDSIVDDVASMDAIAMPESADRVVVYYSGGEWSIEMWSIYSGRGVVVSVARKHVSR